MASQPKRASACPKICFIARNKWWRHDREPGTQRSVHRLWEWTQKKKDLCGENVYLYLGVHTWIDLICIFITGIILCFFRADDLNHSKVTEASWVIPEMESFTLIWRVQQLEELSIKHRLGCGDRPFTSKNHQPQEIPAGRILGAQ